MEASVQTRNIDEAVEAVSRLLVPHSIKVMSTRERIDARLQVRHPTSQPLISLSYGAPVAVDAGDFTGLFLVKHCLRGAAQATQGRAQGEWREGQTMLLSAGADTQLRFDQACAQQSLRLDPIKMEQLCARLLGYPLESPLRFDLRPFTAELDQVWHRTLLYLYPGDGNPLPLTAAAQASLDEFLLTLLLHQHRHNYSEELAEPVPTPVPGIVRRAERYMQDHAEEPIVISDVAAELAISVRTLQAAFRQWRNTTPQLFLRDAVAACARGAPGRRNRCYGHCSPLWILPSRPFQRLLRSQIRRAAEHNLAALIEAGAVTECPMKVRDTVVR